MDPFEVRMHFIEHLRRLNASQQSIQKVVSFAVKHFPQCGEDIWDCIVEETSKGSINSRINILYFLDTLCETSLLAKSHSKSEKSRAIFANGLYVQFISRDLDRVVQSIVPEGKQGLPNLVSTKQILENWRSKRYIDPQKVDDMLAFLDSRSRTTATSETLSTAPASTRQSLSRNEVNKRIEQDRERHKRLRERRWVQPTLHNPPSFQPPQLACFYPLTELGEGQEELALDIEFENEWETTSDWNEDDEEAIGEEAQLAFPEDCRPGGPLCVLSLSGVSATDMIHTQMEVGATHPSPFPRLGGPPGLSLATFGHYKPRMSKRERSPEATDPSADRPSKRAAGEHILATTSSSGSTHQQHSDDWVQQAGGLRIDGSSGLSQGNGIAGPGPSTSAQMDEDFVMAIIEEDAVGEPPVQEERSFAQQQPTSNLHSTQLLLPQRSLSLPNPGISTSHPYEAHWVQQRMLSQDGSPLINVVPATPAGSQHCLPMTDAPTGVEHHHHHLPQYAQNNMLQTPQVPRETPPLSDPTGMSVLTPSLVHQDLSSSIGKNKRVAFGPRLDCEKCRQGETHFAHVHYE